jgi:hypothetical protein
MGAVCRGKLIKEACQMAFADAHFPLEGNHPHNTLLLYSHHIPPIFTHIYTLSTKTQLLFPNSDFLLNQKYNLYLLRKCFLFGILGIFLARWVL